MHVNPKTENWILIPFLHFKLVIMGDNPLNVTQRKQKQTTKYIYICQHISVNLAFSSSSEEDGPFHFVFPLHTHYSLFM